MQGACPVAPCRDVLNNASLVATLFAPVDEAFSGINVTELVANKPLLTAILLNHVVPGQTVDTPDISNGTCYDTLYKCVPRSSTHGLRPGHGLSRLRKCCLVCQRMRIALGRPSAVAQAGVR